MWDQMTGTIVRGEKRSEGIFIRWIFDDVVRRIL